MNSKEAIKNIKRTMIINRNGNIDVGNKYNKEIIVIEKDLEILDILTRNIFVADNTIYATPNELNIDDYNKLKEWLNDSNKNKKMY